MSVSASSLYSSTTDDPISLALRPPPQESEAERRSRLEREAEAKRISDDIDERLRQDLAKYKKSKTDVKLLLLGQAESGKSTLQKQFQLMYRPKSLDDERSSWRTVVYFNVVRSIKHILTTLESWEGSLDDENSHTRSESSGTPMDIPTRTDARQNTSFAEQPSPTSSLMNTSSVPSPPRSDSQATTPPMSSSPPKETSAYQIANLRLRLSPLAAADSQLADRLSGGVTVSGSGKGGVFVRSGWQTRTMENGHRRGKKGAGHEGDSEDALVEDVGRMLDACKHDIKNLWNHPTVKMLIAKRRLRLDEWAEYFLSHILRISAHEYIPTTDDILHARIQTMGVAEHCFDVHIHGKAVTWHIFDVGGARGQRNSWVPYFDDANAIIFVAPISAFDQYLDEDARTNRIDDSLQLFTQICSNPLLKMVHLVLFLNKTDLLQAKLATGLQVRKYITSFGERTNDYETAVQYFRAHFLQVHRKNNEKRRVLYSHLTSVVNTKATHSIIGNVRDSIFRGYLKSAALV